MSARNRPSLKEEFKDGERPSGQDFADLIDSFLNLEEDEVSVDAVSKDLILSGGLQLNSSTRVTAPGTLQFTGTQVQYSDGANWIPLASGGGGAFQPIGDTGAVAYADGNVGIGDFTSSPTYRLEIPLGNNSGPAQQVRFGNAVCSNGQGAFQGYAYFSHQDHTSNIAYGFRQGRNGNVHINAPSDQPVSIRQNGSSVRLGITSNDGHVVVGSETDLAGANQYQFQVDGSAFKSDGEDNWNVLSDLRVKENIRDLEAGLSQLMQVRPVRFRYNGKAGTPKGKESVGIIGQEMEAIFPEMIQRAPSADEFGSDGEPLRIYNGSALTYVLVNAVKELTGRVKELEGTLARLQRTSQP